MNHNIVIQSSVGFTFTEKAYIPTASNFVIIAEELIHVMQPYYGKSVPRFKLVNNLRFDCPQTLDTYDEIHINCMDSFWCQIAFQFSHEFCHLMIGKPVTQCMRWFEESVAELASNVFMLKLAPRWNTLGILGNPEYADSLVSYVSNRLSSDPCQIPLHNVSDPASSIWNCLIQNPENRIYNLMIANKLLPIFDQHPELWKIVPLLGDLSIHSSFGEYLDQWEEIAGTSFHEPLSKIRKIFNTPDMKD